MLKFRETKVAKKQFYGTKKKEKKNWDVNVDNIVAPNLIEKKINSKYLVGCLDEVMRPLILILPKMEVNIRTIN